MLVMSVVVCPWTILFFIRHFSYNNRELAKYSCVYICSISSVWEIPQSLKHISASPEIALMYLMYLSLVRSNRMH